MITVYVYKKDGKKVTFPGVTEDLNDILVKPKPETLWKTFYLLAEDFSTLSITWDVIDRITLWDEDKRLLMEREVWNSSALVVENQ